MYTLWRACEESLPGTEDVLVSYNPLLGYNYFFKVSLTQDLVINTQASNKNLGLFCSAGLAFGGCKVLLFESDVRGHSWCALTECARQGVSDEEYQQSVKAGLELLARHFGLLSLVMLAFIYCKKLKLLR